MWVFWLVYSGSVLRSDGSGDYAYVLLPYQS